MSPYSAEKVCHLLNGTIFINIEWTKRSVIFASSQNKRKQTTSILALSKDFSAVSAGGSEVSLLHWTDDVADFAYLSAGSLDSTFVFSFDVCLDDVSL